MPQPVRLPFVDGLEVVAAVDLDDRALARVRENHRPPFSTNWLEEGRRFGQYKVELEHFVECVRTHAQPRYRSQ